MLMPRLVEMERCGVCMCCYLMLMSQIVHAMLCPCPCSALPSATTTLPCEYRLCPTAATRLSFVRAANSFMYLRPAYAPRAVPRQGHLARLPLIAGI